MTVIELDPEEVQLLSSCGVRTSSLRKMPGKKVHDFMIWNDAFTDGEKLVFFDRLKGGSTKDQDKFIYYIGGEREAAIEARFAGITVWEGLSESRLSYHLSDEEFDFQELAED